MKTKKLLYVVFATILLSICILLSLYGAETGKYIECSQCGKKNLDTNIFCRFCGMRLSKQVEEAREDSTVTDIVETLYQDGVNFIMSGNYYAALGIFEKIIEEFSDSPYAAYANPLHKTCKDIISLNDDLATERIKNFAREKTGIGVKDMEQKSVSGFKRVAQGCGGFFLAILLASGLSCLF